MIFHQLSVSPLFCFKKCPSVHTHRNSREERRAVVAGLATKLIANERETTLYMGEGGGGEEEGMSDPGRWE